MIRAIPLRRLFCPAVCLFAVLAAAAAGLDLDLDDPVERSGGLSLDAPGEAPPAGKAAPACGIVADFYFNLFGETLPQLEALVRDGTPPDLSLRLPTAATRNPWNPAEKELVARLCGVVLSGWIVPEEEGDYHFIVSQSPVPRRLFLAPDGDPAHAGEVALVPSPRHDRAEKAVSLDARHEWKTVSRRAEANEAPIHLEAGQACYFALHLLTSYAGEGLDLTWANASGDNLRKPIPTEALRPERQRR